MSAVIDPGGLSAFKPGEGVAVTALEMDGQYDRPGRALAVEAAGLDAIDE